MAAGGDVSGADAAASAASASAQLVPGGLSWPAVRGARLLRLLMPCADDEALESDTDSGEGEARLSDASARSASASALDFELELCVPAPGHVALVLTRRTAGGGRASTASTPTAAGQPSQQRDGGAEAAALTPRVVYVMDAVPPKSPASMRSQPSDSTSSSSSGISSSASASIPPDTRRTTSAPAPSKAGGAASASATATPTKPKGGRFALSPVLLSQQDVDEVELIEELLAVPRASGSDSAIIAKAPLLCARFDCRVVGVRFVGAEASKVSAAGTSAPLRCVVAREDGMAFLWEWRADLHQWTFMNRFCFLENPNLAWTKPVVAFTATQSAEQPDRQPGGARGSSLRHHRSGTSSAGVYGAGDGEEEAGGPMELAWWSIEVKHEPKLWQRSVRFVRETNTFRTDVVVGSAHAILPPSCTDVTTLLASKLGLWALSATAGIFFRSASLLSTLSMSWEAATTAQDSTSGRDESPNGNESTSSTLESVAVCPHNVTGELLVFQRATGAVFLVSPPQSSSLPHKSLQLRSKKLTTLTPWQGEDHDVKEVAGHRHLLVVLAHLADGSAALYIHSLVTGKRLEALALPCVSLAMPPTLMPALSSPTASASDGLSAPLQLWILAGKASAVGLWSPSSFWTLCLPSAKQVAAAHRSVQQDPTAAFVAVKHYGESSRLDAALFALDSLEQTVTFVASAASGSEHEGTACRVDDSDPKWQAAVASMSNPALLLALMTSGSRCMPTALIDELAALVGAVHGAALELSVGGRGALVRKSSSRVGNRNRQDDGGDVGINKDVIAAAGQRLVTPVNLESLEHLANWILLAKRKVASLQSTAFGDGNATGAGAGVSRAEQQRVRVRAQVEVADDDQDASNFRLSRKLRPMSNLRFAAQSCALGAHGKQWLAQLEAFLLANVSFKKEDQDEEHDGAHVAMPNHLLFHEERVLDDYARHGGASSFSKHMYLESMSRLYLLHEPASLVVFVECVERFCPRLFSLAGRANVAKSHAERALALLPPASLFVERVHKSVEAEAEAARASLVAYVTLLCHCGHWVEASRALLDCDLYERCKSLVLAPLVGQAEDGEVKTEKEPGIQVEDEKLRADRQVATASVYFALVEHCVRRHYDADELATLVTRKPRHVATLTLLRALRGWLEAAAGEGQEQGEDAARVTVGRLRSVLSALLTTTSPSAVR